MPANRKRPGMYCPNQEYAIKNASTKNRASDTTRRTASIMMARSMTDTIISWVVILSTL